MRTALTGRKALDVLASHGRSDWFRISNAAKPDAADVWIYDEIGYFGTPASEFIEQIQALEAGSLNVHINSRGGDVFDGIAVYNAIRQHPAQVRTVVDSMAASIASVIAQAGDERVMVTSSQMMIHEAWGIASGAAADMRKYAETLDRQSDIIAGIYAERSGRTAKYFRSLMAEETWMDHGEAVTHGLADTILAPPSKGTDRTDDKESAAKAQPNWAAMVAELRSQELFV